MGIWIVALAALAAITAGLMYAAPAAQAADNEKCFGIAAAGQNDCQAAGNSCAGREASQPHDGDPTGIH